MADYSSGSKSSQLIIAKYFVNWVLTSQYVAAICWHFSTGVLNCLGLKPQDKDSKGKSRNTKTDTVMVKTETKTVTLKIKTKTVKILLQDKAVSIVKCIHFFPE